MRFFTQHVSRFWLPRADATGDFLRAQIPFGIGAVKRHIIQLQTVGLEGERRGLWREI
ncbi:hypothetical protein D3C86_2172170 [compost metagenome]